MNDVCSCDIIPNDGITDVAYYFGDKNFKNKKKNITPPSKYITLKEIKNLQGFVVNVHDATNLDIDIQIPNEHITDYKCVVSNEYLYIDYEDYDIDCNNPVQTGIAYRCRLKGVGIDQNKCSNNSHKPIQLTIEVKKLIDRNDGWVTCSISDVDIYSRLLVDIYIDYPGTQINLREFLLSQMDSCTPNIFYPYCYKF